MPQSVHPLIKARRDQMFPVLEPAEIDRLARFGERKSYGRVDASSRPAKSRPAPSSSCRVRSKSCKPEAWDLPNPS